MRLTRTGVHTHAHAGRTRGYRQLELLQSSPTGDPGRGHTASGRTATPAVRVLDQDRAQYIATSVTLGDDVPVTIVGLERHLVSLLPGGPGPGPSAPAPLPLLLTAYGAYGA